MELKATQTPRDPAITISSYTSAVRRAEEDAERRAKAHFEQWKALELVQMKLEESKRAKEHVNIFVTKFVLNYSALPQLIIVGWLGCPYTI